VALFFFAVGRAYHAAMRKLIFILLITAIFAGGCLPKAGGRNRVLLIGIEGVDWQLLNAMVKAGEAPNLARLRQEGAWGVLESDAPVRAAGLWVTVATGRTEADHNVITPIQYDPVASMLRVPERGASTVWEILAHGGVPAAVIGWPGSSPLPSDVKVGVDDLALYRGLGIRTQLDGDTLPTPAAPADFPAFGTRVPKGGDLSTQLTAVSFDQYPRLARKAWPQVRFLAVYLEGLNTTRHYAGAAAAMGTALTRPAFGRVTRRHVQRLDKVLGELFALATPETMVIVVGSNPNQGPFRGEGADFAHPIRGLVAVMGPGIAPGRRMENPSVLDPTPFALDYLGQPASLEMPGDGFAEAWRAPVSHQARVASLDVFIRRPYAAETPLQDESLRGRMAEARDISRTMGRPFNARNRYALELLEEGKLDGAVTEALRDLEEDANNSVSQYVLGEVRLYRGKPAEALVNFDTSAQSLADAPQTNAERLLRALIARAAARAELAVGKPELAIERLAPALTLCPGCAEPVELLATAHLAIGENRRAAAVAQAATEQHKDRPGLWLVLGRARRAAGDLAGAQEALEKSLDHTDGPAPEVRRELGLIAIAQNRWDVAAKQLRAVAEAEPHDSYAWLQLAAAYRQLDEPDKQRDALVSCLRVDPENVEAWMAWRQLARAAGEHETAAELLAAGRESIAAELIDF
jgi:tetratricopeptide (TPR) repeat protein